MVACFKKSANYSQKAKRWRLSNWKVRAISKRSGWTDTENGNWKPYIFLLMATGTASYLRGNHGCWYIKIYTRMQDLIPFGGPSGFGLKISAIAWADWGPKNGGGAEVMIAIKIMGSHIVIESLTTKVKLWMYAVLPYIQITGGVSSHRRIFEFENMANEHFMSARSPCTSTNGRSSPPWRSG